MQYVLCCLLPDQLAKWRNDGGMEESSVRSENSGSRVRHFLYETIS